MAIITLNVTDEEKKLITDFSEANNMSISELILKIIEDLEDEEDYKLALERINDPNNNLISVVFPAPLTPIIPILSFSSTEKDISLKRVSPEKPIYISFTCNIAKIPPQTIIFSLFFYQNKQL